ELSAFRTIYRIFQKQGLTSFDPDRIDTPDLKEHVRIPIVERMLESRFESVGTRNTRRCELRFYIDHVCAAAGIEVAEDLEREAIANLRSPRTEALDSADSTV